MAIWWIFFMVRFINNLGICSVLRSSRPFVCIGPPTLEVMARRGMAFQHLALISSSMGLYLSSFVCMVGQ